MYFASLVTGFHRSQDPTALCQAIKLCEYRLLNQIGKLLDDETALIGIFVARQPPLTIDDQLYSHSPAH